MVTFRALFRTLFTGASLVAPFAFMLAAVPLDAGDGLWLLPRKDPQNTARSDVPGEMTVAPREVWKFGGDARSFSSLFPVQLADRDAYLGQVHSGLRLEAADGAVLWSEPKLGVSSVIAVEDFASDGAYEALVTRGPSEVALVDATTGDVRWTWTAPAGAAVGSFKIWRHDGAARFICFPQNALSGVCIDLAAEGDVPAIVWERSYPGTYWQGFGPHIVLADMNRDAAPEVVLAGKPGYAAVIDAMMGAMLFDVRYEITGGADAGRPYGLVEATDLDGDGYCDLVVASCQVEEYVAVLRNENGKGLRHLWSLFIEKDLPDDVRELRPNVTSVIDLDGDNKQELVVGLFNVTGDDRWHTVVIDPLAGFDVREADLAGRYFWGCYDLDGDGRPEIVTSDETSRVPAETSTLYAVDGVTFRDVATVSGARLETTSASPLPAEIGFMAIRATPRFHRTAQGGSGLLLSKRDGKTGSWLWSARDGASQFHEVKLDPLSSVLALSTGTEELQRVELDANSGGETPLSAGAPLIGVSGGKPQLVFAVSDGTVRGGEPDLSGPGKFQSSWSVPGQMPALWVSPAGELTIVTAVDEATLLISRPASDDAAGVTVKLPHPLYRNATTRSGPTILPFGDEKLLLYVGLQTGVHTLASALYDAAGTLLWIDEKEGPYPRTAAFAELAGEPTLLIDNHGKHVFYDVAGHSRLIAHGWNETIPGRGDGAKYVVPIVGPFGPNGETRVLMSSGLQSLETLDAAGKRLAKQDFASTYEFEWNSSAVGRIRPDGGWDLAMVTRDGILHCFDAATCRTRWTFDLGCKATLPINIVSGDLDADGRDNFLVGLPDGTLLALDERDGRGEVLWRLAFDSGIRDTIIGDLDSDGRAEIVVETEDGAVRVLKATPQS